ncbi:hypothetical protein ABZM97_16405 [Bacillus vallismortis]|uniref:Transposase n=1 Tax=Bacillus vallismortis TaxID=72361 RepID=A0ABY4XWD4_BACVA|nr:MULTISPECIES: hypothetical protein [Bacillus]MBL3648341.1 hypothetical protein [Bacillus sp. RHFS10]MDM5303077.1 hypothetical protein [Bacillus subtilis]MDM5325130.1 hypothetical protein [Bacillus subtilis]USP94622.1 hypothetical protein MKF32_15565 [Bacillus vallismortis]
MYRFLIAEYDKAKGHNFSVAVFSVFVGQDTARIAYSILKIQYGGL